MKKVGTDVYKRQLMRRVFEARVLENTDPELPTAVWAIDCSFSAFLTDGSRKTGRTGQSAMTCSVPVLTGEPKTGVVPSQPNFCARTLRPRQPLPETSLAW